MIIGNLILAFDAAGRVQRLRTWRSEQARPATRPPVSRATRGRRRHYSSEPEGRLGSQRPRRARCASGSPDDGRASPVARRRRASSRVRVCVRARAIPAKTGVRVCAGVGLGVARVCVCQLSGLSLCAGGGAPVHPRSALCRSVGVGGRPRPTTYVVAVAVGITLNTSSSLSFASSVLFTSLRVFQVSPRAM